MISNYDDHQCLVIKKHELGQQNLPNQITYVCQGCMESCKLRARERKMEDLGYRLQPLVVRTLTALSVCVEMALPTRYEDHPNTTSS